MYQLYTFLAKRPVPNPIEKLILNPTLEIATHVTIITQGTEKLTVFLLDADQLVPPVQTVT